MFDKIVLASNNQGKLLEFQHLFDQANLPIQVLPQSEFGIGDAVEDGLSFVENALIKARYASRLSGLPAMADDSGISVPVLQGRPAIYSARYAQDEPDFAINKDQANNAKLLRELLPFRGKPIVGQFVCVLALVRHAEDSLPLIAQGIWQGEILEAPQGENGFGYDPLFWLPNLQKTTAQMDKAEKNQISHRGMAMQDLLGQIATNFLL
ncbi:MULTISPECIES: RdgB/HAM1 family non-canonical purine NTP pyrophosphatase [unclassified Moraxella]|uniref:RdgB/HAM1 family non-canonical purine NTP pyrophosphatase n=1 Tax=unclassified Moraxella TaxID=2685852 RepID=UPI003AF8FC21